MTMEWMGDSGAEPVSARTAEEALADDMPTGFRRDIEGLRAIAVIVVLLYHAHLGPTDGGFLGVDVFFVVSGYLITSLLMKDLLLHGGRALPRFWGRRARRLLPASLLVVIVTLIAGRFMLDPLSQADLANDALWASGFVINIKFAMGDGYVVSQSMPTPLLHFWSLAVEEQFYMIWPLLMYALTRVRWHTRRYAMAIMAALFLQSLLAFVWFSDWARTATFFLLPTRAWELIAGALLAVTGGAALRLSPTVRAAAAWFGLFLIGYCVVSYDDMMNLGYAALLPVIATVLVIAGTGSGHLNEPAAYLGMRPMVWVGQRSYGIYLWHWPALVLIDAKFGPLSAPARVMVLLGAVGAAALSYHYVENPVRQSKWLAAVPRRSLLLGGSLVAAGALAAMVMIHLPSDIEGGGVAAAPTLPQAVADTGLTTTTLASGATTTAGATTVPGPTTTFAPPPPIVPLDELLAAQLIALNDGAQITEVPSNVAPPLASAKADKAGVYRDGCVLKDGSIEPNLCEYGDLTSSTVIALFGDSHAAQWFPALEELANTRHWKLTVFVKSGCPTADVRIRRTFLDPECTAWRAKVVQQLGVIHPTMVVMSSAPYDPGGSDVGLDSDDVWRRGLNATLDQVRPTADKLLIIGDTPLPIHEIPNCLSAQPRNVRGCLAPRGDSVDVSRVQLEREVAGQHDANFVSVSDWLCGTWECPVIIGNMILYRDNNHISATASRYFAPFLAAVMVPMLT
jgi:peptidoglycan/LPS O-acetylase OafA/YrhL